MTARERFANTVWSALDDANRLPVEEHAQLAHRAGGPSIPELIDRITAHRAIAAPLAA